MPHNFAIPVRLQEEQENSGHDLLWKSARAAYESIRGFYKCLENV